MAKIHPCFARPTGDTVVWRYMDFSKFVSLVTTGKLYCPNAATFEDALEGTYPAAQIQKKLDKLKTSFDPETAQNILDSTKPFLALEQLEAQEWMYISCWHMNEYESAGMWKLYAKSSDAIAIKTTFAKLEKSIGDEVPNGDGIPLAVYIGSIEYIDPNVDVIDKGPGTNTFNLLLHKRKSFEHEKELRIVIPEPSPWRDTDDITELLAERRGKRGLSIAIDLNELIEQVFVAPSSPGWYKESVKNVLDTAGFKNKQVFQSDLDSKALI